MSQPTVALEGVCKTFRYRPYARGTLTLKAALLDVLLFRPRPPKVTVEALKDISFTLEPGAALGLIGPNGAGKSTLLRLVGDVYQPDRGTVKVRGRRGVLLDLGGGFHPDLSGYDNAEVASLVAGMSRAEFLGRVDAIAAFAGLDAFMQAPLRTYSSGMTLRLGFAVAAHLSPDLLVVDEVLAVGDQSFQAKCLRRIAELRAGGTALLVASHAIEQVQELCDEVIHLEKGEVVRRGDPAEVCQAYLADSSSAPR